MILFGRPTVSITPERPVYLPGEAVQALVQIRGAGALALQEVRVELRRHQRYAYDRRSRNNDGGYRWSRASGTDELICGVVRILGEGSLHDGMVIEQVVAFRLPDSAEATENASLIDTTWDVHLVLNRHRAIDVTARAGITVLAPAALCAGRIASDWRGNAPDECSVAFQLPTQQARMGGAIQGTLIVHARRAVEARRLRVELERVEKTSGGPPSYTTRGCNTTSIVIAQPVAPGGTLPFDTPVMVPFTLPIPPNLPPTTFSANGSVRWLLRGVVDRSFASDYWGEIEVNVYNGPDLPVAPSDMQTILPPPPPPISLPPDAPESAAPDTSPDTRLVLIATSPPNLFGRTITIAGPQATLGRRETSTVMIPEETVSRDHATIRREGDAYFIQDIGSTGGTWINGESIGDERPLHDGDTLALGRAVSFKVSVVSDNDG